jgi:hypothetical protein
MTQTYEKMRNTLSAWENEKPLETALKGLSAMFGVNKEPQIIAQAIEEIAARGREIDNTMAMCLVLALWVSRPFNADSSTNLATLYDSLESESIAARIEPIFPISFRTTLPSFLPRASELVNRLETLSNDRTTEMGQSERLLALELVRFLKLRRHRYQ